MASSKIQLSSWGPVLSVPLLRFTAHLRLLLFPEISLGSFFTSSLLSLPAHMAKHETSSSWGTHVTEYRQRFWGVVETRIQQPFRSASNLHMEEFGSYMNLAVSFLFVAKLGTLLKIRQEERKKILQKCQGSLSLWIRTGNGCSGQLPLGIFIITLFITIQYLAVFLFGWGCGTWDPNALSLSSYIHTRMLVPE